MFLLAGAEYENDMQPILKEPDPQKIKDLATRATELAKELRLDPSRAIGAALTEAGIMNIVERQIYFGPVANAKEFRAPKGRPRLHGMDASEAEARGDDHEEHLPRRKAA